MVWLLVRDRRRDARTGSTCRDTVDPVEWARVRLGFEPDETQARLLGSRSERVVLNCTRQWGKSTVTAARAVWEATAKPGSLTLVASPSGRQSREFMRKAAGFMRALRLPVKGDGDNEISLKFPNGSRIVGLPGKADTTRGFSSVSLLIIDEASRVKDELYHALRPGLARSKGGIWLMSTPAGPQGFFYRTWKRKDERWERVSVKAEECDRIPAEFLAEEREELGEEMYRQEYCCEFVEVEGWMFKRNLTEKLLSWRFEGLKVS